MVSKILSMYIIIAIITFSVSVLYFQQQESETKIELYKEKFGDIEWNNEVTKILPREGKLEEGWTFLWSDGAEEYIEGQTPITITRTIQGSEISSTSYSYSKKSLGTYQILIWKGDLVADWNPKESIENIFLHTDAKIEQILDVDVNENCVVAYYDFYGDEQEIKNDSLFAECAKKDYKIRINFGRGNYNQESIDMLVYLSNQTVGKI